RGGPRPDRSGRFVLSMSEQKLKLAVVGLGKMGLSHFAIAHPGFSIIDSERTDVMVDVPTRVSDAVPSHHIIHLGKAHVALVVPRGFSTKDTRSACMFIGNEREVFA
ncbi:MAG: hypothetical protein KDJ29_21305, partial [Hyphomicrobiales bacterium]|nr:hypothetical protein [Hyphomicrobiales bacterium]